MTRSRTAYVLVGVLSTFIACAARAADAVWILRGDMKGQGQMVQLGNQCLAITAAHVAGDGKSPITLVDQDRNSSPARIVASDTRHDLALLEVPQPRGAGRTLCTRTPKVVVVWPRAQSLQLAPRAPNVWLDKVVSASGELERFNLTLLSEAPADLLHLARSNSRFGQRDPGPSDSGSPVWMTDRPALTPERLYTADGRPQRVTPGYRALVGLYRGRAIDKKAVVVPGDLVRSFVLQALEPVDPAGVSVTPATARLIRADRGPLPLPRAVLASKIDAAAVDTMWMELDLGRRETVVRAVTVLTNRSGGKVAVATRQRLEVHSSAYRPEEDGTWAKERCTADRSRGVGPSTRCEFASPKVVRGLRLEIQGALSSVRAIEIETQDR